MKSLSFLIFTAALFFSIPTAHAAPEEKIPTLNFRVLVAGPKAQNNTLWLAMGDAPRMQIELSGNNFSPIYSPPLVSNLNFFTDQTADPKVAPIASVSIPAGAEKVILVFIPKEGASNTYDTKVLIDDAQKLPGSGAVIFNLSPYTISGVLAGNNLQIASGARQDIMVPGIDSEAVFADVDLSYTQNGGKDRFFVTRWTFTKERRFLVFIYWNAQSGSMNLKSIPDRLPEPPPKPEPGRGIS